MSQVKTQPSKPDVTNNPSSLTNSIFFTQLEWPLKVLIFCLRFLISHNATVVSSEQVAKVRQSRNLNAIAVKIYRSCKN